MSSHTKPPISPTVRAWVEQLIALGELLEHAGDRQVEVRLFANKRRVKARPTVIFDGGPQPMVHVGE